MNKYRRDCIKYWSALLVLVLSIVPVMADVPIFGIPEIQYFNRRNYHAGTQNWSISQAENGLIYSANNDGILEFDGTRWRLLPRINNNIVRAVLAYQGKVYVGAYNDFGYFEYNGENDFEYKSLADTNEFSNLGDIWNVIPFGDIVVFQADRGLILYHPNGEKTLVKARSRISSAFVANGLLLMYDEVAGLLEFRQNNLFEVPGGDYFAGKSIGAILPLNSREVLIATITHGLYVWDYRAFTKWDVPAADFLRSANVFCGIEYGENELAFGTIQSGVVVTDKKGQINMMVNKERGLQNNTVLGISYDKEGNIWAGLDNGIARIAYNSTISFIQGYYDIGTGYTFELHNSRVYLGTNQALYSIDYEIFKKPIKDKNNFKRITGTSGQVWSLFTDRNGNLLCGHNSGVFQIIGDEARQITPTNIVGAWIFRYPPGRDDILLVGSYNGILLLENVNNRWVFRKKLEGFHESARFMEWDTNGSLWVTHGSLGVFRIFFDKSYSEIISVDRFKEARGLEEGTELTVTLVNDEVVFSSIRGIFGYDNASESFYRHGLNSYFFQDGYPVKMQSDRFMNIWYFTQTSVGVLRRLEDGSYSRVTIPFLPIQGRLVNGFEFLKEIDEKNVLIGVEDGFAHYSVNETKNFLKPFRAHIRGFKHQGENVAYFLSSMKPDQSFVARWPFKNNAFEVHYSATHFETDLVRYATFLEGLDEDWSDFSLSNQRQFTNIREGDYVFWVKASNIFGVETEPIGFKFTVLPPWYRTAAAHIIYGVFVFILLIGSWYLLMWLLERSKTLELQKQEEKFRITEDKLRNEALENEKEMIRLRNEKLRNEMLFKEKELANSTMNIIQKNEFLVKIKDELLKILRYRDYSSVEKKINDIVRKIDRDIDNESHWEVFELHLEQVHEDFLKRLREMFPELTSKEQKLCAYLRMDMPSKEISSLMNISVRAVENNRYKLRKKLGLDGGDNLSDFIMSI